MRSPKKATFWISVILGALGVLGTLGIIPAISSIAFWLLAAGWLLLVLGCAIKGL